MTCSNVIIPQIRDSYGVLAANKNRASCARFRKGVRAGEGVDGHGR